MNCLLDAMIPCPCSVCCRGCRDLLLSVGFLEARQSHLQALYSDCSARSVRLRTQLDHRSARTAQLIIQLRRRTRYGWRVRVLRDPFTQAGEIGMGCVSKFAASRHDGRTNRQRTLGHPPSRYRAPRNTISEDPIVQLQGEPAHAPPHQALSTRPSRGSPPRGLPRSARTERERPGDCARRSCDAHARDRQGAACHYRGYCHPASQGGDATSWLMQQADYDLKTLSNLRDIEEVVRRA